MIDIVNKEECCGCNACTNICPKQCISMEIDNEGFWYPKVDKSKCIDCDLCVKVCPIINTPKIEKEEIIAYACKNKELEARVNSSSGGVFGLLCKEVIGSGGVVFGAAYDENFDVRHTYAETIEDCNQFRGSKYVQSEIGDTYKQTKKFLNEGRVVLFSGTQCQIKGLNLYLMKKYENLITVDIVCHGVPSPKVFKSYKELLVKKYKGNIKDIRFRDKRKGWKEFSYITEFDNGAVHSETLKEDVYMKGFLKDLYLRPSCYSCTSKNYTDGSDLSLADYWGVQNIHPEFDDDKGVSLVIVNTAKGKQVLEKIKDRVDIIETDLDYAIKHNKCIVKSVDYNPKREGFFKEFNGENLESVVEKYTRITLGDKVKSKAKGALRRVKRIIS